MSKIQHILVIDDDPRVLRVLETYLQREGYDICTANCVDKARQQISAQEWALIILDIGLPDEDGFSFAREIRTQSSVPLIMLTGKTETIDKVVGLELGADDYITKPFEERELLARIRSVLRRSQTSSNSSPEKTCIACFSDWRLDLSRHELFSPNGEQVHLTSHEFRLLEVFIECPNRVLSRDMLMDRIVGRDWNSLDRSIDVLIAKLRKKIEQDPTQPRLIKSIRGEGYKFIAELEMDRGVIG